MTPQQHTAERLHQHVAEQIARNRYLRALKSHAQLTARLADAVRELEEAGAAVSEMARNRADLDTFGTAP